MASKLYIAAFIFVSTLSFSSAVDIGGSKRFFGSAGESDEKGEKMSFNPSSLAADEDVSNAKLMLYHKANHPAGMEGEESLLVEAFQVWGDGDQDPLSSSTVSVSHEGFTSIDVSAALNSWQSKREGDVVLYLTVKKSDDSYITPTDAGFKNPGDVSRRQRPYIIVQH